MKKMMTIAMCAAAVAAMAAEPAAPAPAAKPAAAPAAVQPAPAPAAQPAPAKSQGFRWRWWGRREDKDVDVRGCALGVASSFRDVSGAQVNIIWSTAKHVKSGCQASFAYSEAETLRNGAQIAFINKAEVAALQFGLLCFNEEGFLPAFPFFNFSKKGFGAAK